MAKPIKGTTSNDLSLLGTNGRDKLQGKDGDDFLTGLGGNDDIDGGQGIDTAFYTGEYDDYVIAFKATGSGKATGNDKLSVTDTVAGRDGADQLKHVEFLQFADMLYEVDTGWTYQVNATVDPAAQDPATPGFLFQGSGNPATDFGIVRNDAAGVELGFKVIHRGGPNYQSTDNYNDGILHFSVNDGPQPSTTNRAEWNFTFSIATGLEGATTDLDDFDFELLIDVDPTAATNFRTFVLEAENTPQPGQQSGYQWRDVGTGLVFISDDEGNGNITQNSQNLGFNFYQAFMTSPYGPGNSFAGPVHFDLVLQGFDGSELIARNHIVVDVIL